MEIEKRTSPLKANYAHMWRGLEYGLVVNLIINNQEITSQTADQRWSTLWREFNQECLEGTSKRKSINPETGKRIISNDSSKKLIKLMYMITAISPEYAKVLQYDEAIGAVWQWADDHAELRDGKIDLDEYQARVVKFQKALSKVNVQPSRERPIPQEVPAHPNLRYYIIVTIAGRVNERFAEFKNAMVKYAMQPILKAQQEEAEQAEKSEAA